MLCSCGCGREASPGRSYLRGHAGHRAIRGRHPWSSRLWTVTDRGYDTPCWIWSGHKQKRWGYGVSRWKGRTWCAHIRAWVEAGRPLVAGMQLDHLCRQRDCVNPDHLEQVSRAVNVQRSRAAKLSRDQVADIRARYTGAYGDVSSLAREFGVSRANIRFIVQGKTWIE